MLAAVRSCVGVCGGRGGDCHSRALFPLFGGKKWSKKPPRSKPSLCSVWWMMLTVPSCAALIVDALAP